MRIQKKRMRLPIFFGSLFYFVLFLAWATFVGAYAANDGYLLRRYSEDDIANEAPSEIKIKEMFQQLIEQEKSNIIDYDAVQPFKPFFQKQRNFEETHTNATHIKGVIAPPTSAADEAVQEEGKIAAAYGSSEDEDDDSLLIKYAKKERLCKRATEFFVIIDAGSTGNRASLLSGRTVSCYSIGRKVIPSSLRLERKTGNFQSIRSSIEEWLRSATNETEGSLVINLRDKFESMVQFAKERMTAILNDVIRLLKESQLPEILERSRISIPVIFHSTAGVRGLHDWYRDGYLMACRFAINQLVLHTNVTFFTNRHWTRHITGREEGAYAFITANHMLGYFERITYNRDLAPHKNLIGIIEVGGASMQVVFPVNRLEIMSPFIRLTDLKKTFLTKNYPEISVLSTSFMQLGIESGQGLLLKRFCQTKENLENGICKMPCFNVGYKQECTTQPVKNIQNKKVVLNKDDNRLLSVAQFCDGEANELKYKKTNRRDCINFGIDPDEPLNERMSIHGCKEIEGTGDLDKCLATVKEYLLETDFVLPANTEAQYVGFDSPLQIFHFLHPQTETYLTGKALVYPIRNLQKWGLLSQNFTSDLNELKQAAEAFCKIPVEESEGVLAYKLPSGERVPLDALNVDTCTKLSYGLLLGEAATKNNKNISVRFELSIQDPSDPERVIGEFGWMIGGLLSTVIEEEWTHSAYLLGPAHFRDLNVL